MGTNSASLVWKSLNGIVCLYKPAGYNWYQCYKSLKKGIVNDLNQLQCREPRNYVVMTGNTSESLDVTVDINYADHPLMVGPRYIPEDVRCSSLKYVGTRTSGVCLVGINSKGIQTVEKLAYCNPISTYHVVGKFGICTHNKAIDGNILYTSNCNYLKETRVDRVIASIESIHRKNLFKQCGFHPQSQEAYELIASGKLRPLARNIPVLYSMKCIDWQLPYFTLEIAVVNEEEDYLLSLVDEIGMRSKNMAVGTSIRCLRTSIFSIEDSLLEKHWDVQSLIDNMDLCRRKLEANAEISQHFGQMEDFIVKENAKNEHMRDQDEVVTDEDDARC